MRTVVKIILALIILALLAFAGYYFFVVKKNSETKSDTVTKTISNIFTRRDPADSNTTILEGTTGGGTGTSSGTTELPFTRIDSRNIFRQITNFPVSGYTAFMSEKTVEEAGTDPKTKEPILVTKKIPIEVLRYTKKETGHVFEGEVTETLIEQKQKTGTEIPKSAFAHFFKKGTSLAFQFLGDNGRTIETVWGAFPPENRVFSYCGAPITKELKRGSTGTEVKSLQIYLGNALQKKTVTDGNFGPGTERLLKELQTQVFLEETGRVDDTTRAHIERDCAKQFKEFNDALARPILLSTQFAPEDIERMSVSPAGDQVFYTRKDQNGVKGFVSSGGTAIPKQVFSSSFSEWMPQWVRSDVITMTTYASRESVGYMYSLNPKDGNFVKSFGPIQGLTTNTSPNGKYILYSESTRSGFVTRIMNLETRTGNQLTLPTLPEKCAWLPDSSGLICAIPKQIPGSVYPDNWYKGLVSFADEFWMIQAEPFQTRLLFTPPGATDFINPVLGPDNRFLYITDKSTGNLWVLTLE